MIFARGCTVPRVDCSPEPSGLGQPDVRKICNYIIARVVREDLAIDTPFSETRLLPSPTLAYSLWFQQHSTSSIESRAAGIRPFLRLHTLQATPSAHVPRFLAQISCFEPVATMRSRFPLLAGLLSLAAKAGRADPTWPAATDHMEAIVFQLQGFQGSLFNDIITPCDNEAAGPGRVTASEWLRVGFQYVLSILFCLGIHGRNTTGRLVQDTLSLLGLQGSAREPPPLSRGLLDPGLLKRNCYGTLTPRSVIWRPITASSAQTALMPRCNSSSPTAKTRDPATIPRSSSTPTT